MTCDEWDDAPSPVSVPSDEQGSAERDRDAHCDCHPERHLSRAYPGGRESDRVTDGEDAGAQLAINCEELKLPCQRQPEVARPLDWHVPGQSH